MKKKTASAQQIEKREDGQAAAPAASGDNAGGDGKDAAADSDDKSEDEGSEEKQLARLHFFRSKVHAKDVNRLVVASFISRYLSLPRHHAVLLQALLFCLALAVRVTCIRAFPRGVLQLASAEEEA
eukprot:COSAG02_NODE_906_length_16039_cov_4.410289_13_plen_126_part_00